MNTPTESVFDSLVNGEYYWIKISYSDTPNKWVIGEWDAKFKQFALTTRSIATPKYVTEIDSLPVRKA
jgi:hypothetical protein